MKQPQAALQRSPQLSQMPGPHHSQRSDRSQLAAYCEAHRGQAGASMCMPGGSVPHLQPLVGEQPLCTSHSQHHAGP